MTEILYKISGDKHNLQIAGHANYGDPGQDIVCAAISMLLFTLVNTLDDVKGIEKEYSLNSGYSKCIVDTKNATPEDKKTVCTIFDTILNGYDILSSNYPEHVTFMQLIASK